MRRSTISTATGQRSLGPDGSLHPLYPVLHKGVSIASEDWNYPLEVEFDYGAVDMALFQQAPLAGLDRWAPLLPPLLPGLSFGEGGTPLIQLPADKTGFEAPVYLKDESRNPTWSHKDRLNLCAVSAAAASGARGVVVASTGNHGVSAAAYAARAGLTCLVFVPSRISATFLAMLRAYGACPIPVDPDHRWPLVEMVVERAGFHPTSNLTPFHTGHPFGPEGYKTIAYELFLQLGRTVPEAIVIPTGYAELLYGVSKGFRELHRLGLAPGVPRLFSVEPSARAPLNRASRRNVPMTVVDPVDTDLHSIACTVGGFRGVLGLKQTGGDALTVDDAAAYEAQAVLGRLGIWQELSSCAAFAALPEAASRCGRGPIVIVGTSGGFKDPLSIEELPVVEPTFESVADHVWATAGIRLGDAG